MGDLDLDLLDIEDDCRGKGRSCFWDKAHDHIEFVFCDRESLPDGFHSVHDCDRAAIKILDDFLESQPKETYRRRRSRRRSRRFDPDPEPEAPAPSQLEAQAPQQPEALAQRQLEAPEPPTPNPVGGGSCSVVNGSLVCIGQGRTRPAVIAGFCDRTAGVKAAVLAASSASACGAVTQAQLDEITSLNVQLSPAPRPNSGPDSCSGPASLRSGDFASLRNLKNLEFGGSSNVSCLEGNLPADIFSGLSKLETIHFGQTKDITFHENVFRNLPKLKKIRAPECQFLNDPSEDPAFRNLGTARIVADC